MMIFNFQHGLKRAAQLRRSACRNESSGLAAPQNPVWSALAAGRSVQPQTLPQAKLEIGAPDDVHEREADAVAERVMRMPEPSPRRGDGVRSDRWVSREQSSALVRPRGVPNPLGNPAVGDAPLPGVWATLASAGRPLDPAVRGFFEPRFGFDFSGVRVHTDSRAATVARAIGARAATSGRDIIFGASAFRPSESGGRGLLAHELVHVVQQAGMSGGATAPEGLVQRDDIARMSITPDYALQLSQEDLEAHIRTLDQLVWTTATGGEEARGIADSNLSILQREEMRRRNFDVTRTCVTPDYARGLTDENLEAQIRILYEVSLAGAEEEGRTAQANLSILEREQVRRGVMHRRRMRGAAIRGLDWGGFARPRDVDAVVSVQDRMLYVMQLLVEHYGFSVIAAAGLVGNLQHESGLIPNMRQGLTLVRSGATRVPRGGGIGLAQWTEDSRRRGLVEHEIAGERSGVDVLFDLDAQVDYMVSETRSPRFRRVNTVLTDPDVPGDRHGLERIATAVFYWYERPASVTHCRAMRPRVCEELNRRIRSAREARILFMRERRALNP